MANPNVNQGTMNVLLGSVVFANYPDLNITSDYLNPGGIQWSTDGDMSIQIPTMVGSVTSDRPFIFANVDIHLIRSQNLASSFISQFQTTTTVGSVSVYSDTSILPVFSLNNCIFTTFPSMSFDGLNSDFLVRLRGVYTINNNLFNVA
jgi:hypothetical protein